MHRLAGLFRKGNDFAEKQLFITGKKMVSADLFITGIRSSAHSHRQYNEISLARWSDLQGLAEMGERSVVAH